MEVTLRCRLGKEEPISLLWVDLRATLVDLSCSAKIKKQPCAQGSANNVQQPSLRHGIGVEHQRDAEPFSRLALSFLAVPIGGEANYAESDGANNIGLTGQGEAERL